MTHASEFFWGLYPCIHVIHARSLTSAALAWRCLAFSARLGLACSAWARLGRAQLRGYSSLASRRPSPAKPAARRRRRAGWSSGASAASRQALPHHPSTPSLWPAVDDSPRIGTPTPPRPLPTREREARRPPGRAVQPRTKASTPPALRGGVAQNTGPWPRLDKISRPRITMRLHARRAPLYRCLHVVPSVRLRNARAERRHSTSHRRETSRHHQRRSPCCRGHGSSNVLVHLKKGPSRRVCPIYLVGQGDGAPWRRATALLQTSPELTWGKMTPLVPPLEEPSSPPYLYKSRRPWPTNTRLLCGHENLNGAWARELGYKPSTPNHRLRAPRPPAVPVAAAIWPVTHQAVH